MDTREFAQPVRRSLLHRDLILGLPAQGLLVLLVSGTFFVYILEQYWFCGVLAAMYVVMRLLTKKDPYMIDILLTHIDQPDIFIP